MTAAHTLPAPLACDVGAIPVAERATHARLATMLFQERLLDRRPIPDGYVLRFAAADLEWVTLWIANERRCCPFLHFGLELDAPSGTLQLRLTGPAGTRAFLAAELPFRRR